jgi:chaperonin GroES
MSILVNGTIFCELLTLLSFKRYFGIVYDFTLSKNLNNLITKNMAKSSLNVKPLADRVLVEPAPAETKTSGGIIIPDTAKEKPMRGKIVAVGNGKPEEPMTVKVGDTVLYGKYAGTELNVEGKEYLIMRESDIYAII